MIGCCVVGGYRDMTFCPIAVHSVCKDAENCSRKLTEAIREDAEEFGVHVWIFTSVPDCYKEKK